MHLSFTFFNLISVATLAVLGGVSAQDDGAAFVFKCKNPGQVALTFDDGPSPFTAKLLDHLAAAKVPATFFVLGKAVNEFPDALKATYNAGHQIALHSNTHADMNALTPAKVLDEYTLNLKAVKDTIGISPNMARPPFGNCNAACAKVLEGQMGLSVIQLQHDIKDYSVAYTPKIIDMIKAKGYTFVTVEQSCSCCCRCCLSPFCTCTYSCFC
ncbi:glycoside hydrolase/deacetylase [Rhizophagus irregularis]|uniref:Glycoside hydrolase/deacetylase n=1 Tax=Rhizophagus irregularis TaxID=588596 RepID=A0A2N1N963_9GLOM|nr:glycoside hydrolase/deacetylase [Rhizophagus irregularis]